MLTTALFLACLICGDDPMMDYGDLPRSGMGAYPFRNMAPAPGDAPARAARPALPYVDLSWPGAIERLAKDNPEHARRAQELLEAAAPLSCEALLEKFRARGDVAEPSCVMRTLLPTDPPRRIVGFRLDQTKYLAWVRSSPTP